MTIRKIVQIDEERCNGCGLCIPSCVEGALKIVDGKAKLLSEKYCDGLGACLGHCPQDAIRIVEREAVDFDEEAVKNNLLHGEGEITSEGVTQGVASGCPGSLILDLREVQPSSTTIVGGAVKSELRQWPIQLRLVSPQAPYFEDSNLLIAADCVPFAYAGFHQEFLRGKTLVMGCPKLDEAPYYIDKLTKILELNNVRSITLLNMEVPCCFGLQRIVEEAIKRSGKTLPIKQTVITTGGEKQQSIAASNSSTETYSDPGGNLGG